MNNPNEAQAQKFEPFYWKGSFHFVSEDFELPTGGLLQAFQKWIFGSTERNIHALKRLKPIDLSTTNQRKRLCDYRFVMQNVESYCSNNECVSMEQCFEAVRNFENSLVPDNTSKSRKRRKEQLK